MKVAWAACRDTTHGSPLRRKILKYELTAYANAEYIQRRDVAPAKESAGPRAIDSQLNVSTLRGRRRRGQGIKPIAANEGENETSVGATSTPTRFVPSSLLQHRITPRIERASPRTSGFANYAPQEREKKREFSASRIDCQVFSDICGTLV